MATKKKNNITVSIDSTWINQKIETVVEQAITDCLADDYFSEDIYNAVEVALQEPIRKAIQAALKRKAL